MNLIDEIFAIRSRHLFSHDDVKVWAVKVIHELFGIPALDIRTEVVIFGKTKGRTDIIADDYVGIETKKSMEHERDDALVQVERFLNKMEDEADSINAVAIATDGEAWEFFGMIHGRLFSYHHFNIEKTWNNNDLKQSLLKPLTIIRGENIVWKIKPTAEAVAEVFRPEGPVFKEARQLLLGSAEQILKSNRVEFDSKFIAWFELFNYVYNNFNSRCKSLSKEINDLGEITSKLGQNKLLQQYDYETLSGALELFFRHTYMAVLSKILITSATLEEHQITKEIISDPTAIASGQLLFNQGIVVAESNDFFIWISHDIQVSKLVAALLRPLKRLSQDFDDDIFRHLYEMIVDPETRHELGEFYTPKWLAQLIVKETIFNSDVKVLDPACGSGTFLVTALKYKASLTLEPKKIKSEILTQLLGQIWGIDVNPLSVILARTNLYLAALSLSRVNELPEEINPHVYVADTFILPRFTKEKETVLDADPDIRVIEVSITPEIRIPIHLDLSMDEMQKYVLAIGERIAQGLPQVNKSDLPIKFADYIIKLDDVMRKLRRRYGNNLWQFILRNYCIPPLIREQFDVVVGNPPWLIFREAKSSIQSTMESVALSAGVAPNVKVKTSFNLAVSFLLASMQFLNPKGVIGFVMPLSVIEGAAHFPFIQAMQSGKLGNLKAVYDLSKISPPPFPHSLAPCALIVENVEK